MASHENHEHKVLIVGATGKIGRALSQSLSGRGWTVLGTSREQQAVSRGHLYLDLSEDVEAWPVPEGLTAAVVCAGIGKVRVCQQDPESTARINVQNTYILIKKLVERGVFVICLSSNRVFDGTRPFVEPDAPYSPVSEYGRQKVEMEKLVRGLGDSVAVVRLTKVLAPDEELFLSWKRDLTQGVEITPFTDVYSSPVSLLTAVAALTRIAEKKTGGVFHVSGPDEISYAQAAGLYARLLGRPRRFVKGVSVSDVASLRDILPRHAGLKMGQQEATLGIFPEKCRTVICGLVPGKDARYFLLVLSKIPAFLFALPFVLLIRLLRPFLMIRFIPISQRIGHAAANIDTYLAERQAGLHPPKSIDIFFNEQPGKGNKQLLKMWARVIPVFDFARWLSWANLEIPGGRTHVKYGGVSRDRDIHGLTNGTPPPVSFTAEEERRGAQLLEDMGVAKGQDIVCFHCRDDAFLEKIFPGHDFTYHNYRDARVENYIPAIEDLSRRGYFSVRMGRHVRSRLSLSCANFFDYADSPYCDDFNDIYLPWRCRFFVGQGSGLESVARIFRKPIVLLNYIPMQTVHSWSPQYLIIVKKLWSKEHKRFLTFREILKSEIGTFYSTWDYERLGLEAVENTPEEILAAVEEMRLRVEGAWETNGTDEDLQRRFWSLYAPNEYHHVFKARIGSRFLLENKGLLD